MQDYNLRLQFGERDVPINIGNLKELTVIQDMNKFLPEFRLKLIDASGVLTHVLPFDKNMSKVYIEFSLDPNVEKQNSMTFAVYQREPDGNQSTPANNYEITGLLDVPNLLTPDHCRGFSGTIASTLETIATELGVENSEISGTLNYEKDLLQIQWTNSQFLKWLKEHVIGTNNEYGYKCFIKAQETKTSFVFKSLSEFIASQVAYKFILSDIEYEDRLPIYNYSIYDNYKVYTTFASKEQAYSYFDYDESEFVSSKEELSSFPSLTDFWLIDKDDTIDSHSLNETGRTNEFTSDFKGYVKSSYGNRLANLVQMWITTKGLPNVVPGQVVEIFFPYGITTADLYSFQYSGYWLVEKVVHNFGDSFLTRLLLTRNGLDTDKETTLVAAESTMQKR